MSRLLLIAAAIVLALGIALALRSRERVAASSDDNPYTRLRNGALQSTRAAFNLPAGKTEKDPWCAVMDWGLDSDTVTVVAFIDGTASIYLSSGGGWIGGAESHDSIRNAGLKMVSAAAACVDQMKVTASFPLPKEDHATFYVLTDSGTYTAGAPMKDISQRKDALGKLGNAAQEVITQYRLVQGDEPEQ